MFFNKTLLLHMGRCQGKKSVEKFLGGNSVTPNPHLQRHLQGSLSICWLVLALYFSLHASRIQDYLVPQSFSRYHAIALVLTLLMNINLLLCFLYFVRLGNRQRRSRTNVLYEFY